MGNIEADAIVFVADLLMARALRARNCLLWYTSSGKPDLGGKEQDDFRHVSQGWTARDGSRPAFRIGREHLGRGRPVPLVFSLFFFSSKRGADRSRWHVRNAGMTLLV